MSKGLHPFCVVATAGTVNTGAIDPLDAIKDICRQYNMWFHVDAAYGGFVAISSEHKSLIKGIAQADSVVVDPHKWLFIPYDVGCVLVKDPKKMKKTFSYPTDYIALDKKKKLSNDEIDFADYSIELSRSFRALKIWMSLKQYGIRRYEKIINQNMKLIEYWQELIKNSQDFQIMAPSVLSVVCFRFNPEKAMKIKNENKELYLDKLNRLIIKSIRENREFLISGTMLNGRYVLRACIVNYRTTKQDVKYIIQALREIGKKNDALLKSKDI